MKYKFEDAKKLIGASLKESDLKTVDAFIMYPLGLFIPINYACGYAIQDNHVHPSYIITINFSEVAKQRNHYVASIFSPNVKHNDSNDINYYAVMIDKDYFETRYKMYADNVPLFNGLKFEMCNDILKYLNMFAFECSKNMINSEITLGAHIELITHWIVRSILGESMDMRAISSDFAVARAQHYIEQHFGEKITVKMLAELGYVSESGLTHKFVRELGVSPIEYLIEIRIQNAKKLLQRKNISMTEIAVECGFSSLAHFSSSFQKRLDISPSEYQALFR